MPRGNPKLGEKVEKDAKVKRDRRRAHGLLVLDALREALQATRKGTNEPDHRTRLQAVKLWQKLRDGKGRKARIRRAGSAPSEAGNVGERGGTRRAAWAQEPAPASVAPQVPANADDAAPSTAPDAATSLPA